MIAIKSKNSFIQCKFLAFSAVAVLFGKRAFAYIDLGTGSQIIQIVLAGLLGSAYVFKNSIRGFLKKIVRRRNKEPKGTDHDETK
jgi:hypothetical protein